MNVSRIAMQSLRSPKVEPLPRPPVSPGEGALTARFSLDWSRAGDASGDSADEAEAQERRRGGGHAVAGTATLEEHLLIRALERDFAPLVILQVLPPAASRSTLVARSNSASSESLLPHPLPIDPHSRWAVSLRSTCDGRPLCFHHARRPRIPHARGRKARARFPMLDTPWPRHRPSDEAIALIPQ